MKQSTKVHVSKLLNKMRLLKAKNRHLIEVACALIFTINMSKTFWGDVILTSTYLINQITSPTLSFDSHLQKLQKYFPLQFKYTCKKCVKVLFLYMFTPIKGTNLIHILLNMCSLGIPSLKNVINAIFHPQRAFVSPNVTFFIKIKKNKKL